MPTPEIIINPALRDLLPPLSAEERSGLETEILQDGCTDELTLWGNVLIDGHHRYEICTKHGLTFKTRQKDFCSLDDAKLWVWQHQNNRRNLTVFQRIEIALKLKPEITDKAKQNQVRKSSHSVCQTSDKQNSIDTKKEIAALARTSHDTVVKAEYILEHADDETKTKLRRGDKGASINKEYKRLKSESKEPLKSSRKSKTVPLVDQSDSPESATSVTLKGGSNAKTTYCCGIQFEPDPDDTEYDWLTEEEKKEFVKLQNASVNPTFPQIRNFTIQNIPEHKPDALIDCLYSLFQVRYREKLAYALLREMYKKEGEEKDLARHIVNTLYHEFN
jgi:hypothetical protein